MTPEDKLALLLGADTPREPDRVFVAETVRRIALRRAIMTVLALVPWAVAGAAILWAMKSTTGGALNATLAASVGRAFEGVGAALEPGLGGLALVGVVLIGGMLVDRGLRQRLVGVVTGTVRRG